MNAHYLHLPDGTPTEWSQCGVCHSVAAPGNFDLSEKCCTCYDCGKPLAKDEKIPYGDGKGNRSLYHRACEERLRSEREAARLEKAELVADYNGPVYCEGWRGSFGDGYFSDVAELEETLDDAEGPNRPEFVHCCTSRGISIDLSRILESATEESYEDCSDDLSGVDELQAAVDAFNKANESVKTWDVDYKRKVVVSAG